MQIELRNIDTIQPYDRNPRMNDKAVDAVAASLREFGFRQPIVIDTDGTIIVGHARYKAALQIGLQKVPVHVATGLTQDQVRAYRLADNKTAELSEWDLEKLEAELSELPDFDMALFGFDELDFQPISADEVPRLDVIDKKPITCPQCGHEFDVSTSLLRK